MTRSRPSPLRHVAVIAALMLAPAVHAEAPNPSAASSAASLLPVGLLVAAPAVLLAGGAKLTVAAVQPSADGALMLVKSSADGAEFAIRTSGQVSVGVGQALEVTALASGWVLSQAGRAVAFIPNTVGRALLHHESVTGPQTAQEAR